MTLRDPVVWILWAIAYGLGMAVAEYYVRRRQK